MNRLIAPLAAVFALTAPAWAAQPAAAPQAVASPALAIPAGRYELDPKHSSLVFRVLHAGLSYYTARFTRFDVAVELDPQDLARSRVEARIDPFSIETDYPGEEDFDGELAKDPKFLEATKFPEIRFVSRQVQVLGPRELEIAGDLTMKGATRPVTLRVEIVGARPHPMSKTPTLGIAARGALERSGWGVSGYLPEIVADRVTFEINAELGASSAQR